MSTLTDCKAIHTDEGLADVAHACGLLIAYNDCSMSEAFARRTATVDQASAADDVMRFMYSTYRWAAGVLSERLGRTVSTDVQRRTVQELTTDDGLAGIVGACNVLVNYLDTATQNADELEALNPGHIEASDELLGWLVGTRTSAENMLQERMDRQDRN